MDFFRTEQIPRCNNIGNVWEQSNRAFRFIDDVIIGQKGFLIGCGLVRSYATMQRRLYIYATLITAQQRSVSDFI